MTLNEKAEIAKRLGDGLHIFLNGRIVACETNSAIEKLEENLEFYRAALAMQVVPLAEPVKQNGSVPAAVITPVVSTIGIVPDINLETKYEWHREASKQIGEPATFRELFMKIKANGIELNAKTALDALTRRIRKDDEMIKVGRRPGTGFGAGEVLYVHRDLTVTKQTNQSPIEIFFDVDEDDMDDLLALSSHETR